MEKVLGWLVAYLTFLYVGYSSPTRDQTWAPCIGSMESEPLDHQGSPQIQLLKRWSKYMKSLGGGTVYCFLHISVCLKYYTVRIGL